MGYPEISGRKRGGRGGSKETCNRRVKANLNHDHVTPSYKDDCADCAWTFTRPPQPCLMVKNFELCIVLAKKCFPGVKVN